MKIEILPASGPGRDWVAHQMAGTDPWVTLGTTIETCIQVCHDPAYLVFVAHKDSLPCGAIILDPRGVAGSPYLKSIVVDAGYRGSGIGKRLLSFAEEYFRASSRHFFLCVSSFNYNARKLYESTGFIKVGEFNDYIINGESEILLYKRLR